MKLKKILLITFTAAAIVSCNKIRDKFDASLNNPNSVPPDQANATLLLNQAQLSFAGFFDATSDLGMQLTRQVIMYGPRYDNAYSPQTYDGLWNTAYTSIFKNINTLLPLADKNKQYVEMGIAKIIKAYTLMTLVDIFGDVPLAEANAGLDNTNPKVDKGDVVYAAAIALLDGAIADLAKTPGSYPGANDLFYGVSAASGKARWVTLAKTLKLRAYVNTRMVDANAKSKIDALLTENDLINSNTAVTGDFEFKYSSKQANPNSRSTRYNGNYTQAGNAGDYIGTYMMWTMLLEKAGTGINSSIDPRIRYYFYRQQTNYANATEASASCINSTVPAHYTSNMPFCLLASGFWGRDHADNSGIPPDGNLRTTFGLYPFGGDFDNNQGTRVSLNRGGLGAGVQPIWQSAFTSFIKAEAALKLGTAGDPRALLTEGVRRSISKVQGFASNIGYSLPTSDTNILRNTTTRINTYVNKVLSLYDAATTDEERMEVIMKEYYIALFGNGVDAYNMYRRTQHPNNMQYTRTASPGQFIYSHLYPSVHVNLNVNAKQKTDVGQQVFWDKNAKTLK